MHARMSKVASVFCLDDAGTDMKKHFSTLSRFQVNFLMPYSILQVQFSCYISEKCEEFLIGSCMSHPHEQHDISYHI